jgi:hypothetical protein
LRKIRLFGSLFSLGRSPDQGRCGEYTHWAGGNTQSNNAQ